MKNISHLTTAGTLSVILGLLLPFTELSLPYLGGEKFSLILNYFRLGELHWIMYIVPVLGLFVLFLGIVNSCPAKSRYMLSSYACFGYFLILLSAYFILSKLFQDHDLGNFVTNFIRGKLVLGAGICMFLVAGIFYLLAGIKSNN